jgi:OOP family OmpA-OmpF porin
MIKRIAVGMAVAAALGAGSASAQWYGGGSVGQSRINYDAGNVAADLAAASVVGTAAVSKTDIGLKLYGGYQFNENFALEGGYFNMGRVASLNGTITSPGVSRTFTAKGEGQGVNLDAVGILPMSNGFSLLGRVGAAYFQYKNTLTVSGAAISGYGNVTSSKVLPLVGIGAQYDFTKTVSGRVEVQRYMKVGNNNTGSGDLDFYSAGVLFRF